MEGTKTHFSQAFLLGLLMAGTSHAAIDYAAEMRAFASTYPPFSRLFPENQLQFRAVDGSGGYAAFVTLDSLHLFRLERACVVSMSCVCSFQVEKIFSTSFPGEPHSKPPPFAFSQNQQASYLVVAHPDGTLRGWVVGWTYGQNPGVTSAQGALPLSPGQIPLLAAPSPSPSATNFAFRVMGSAGLAMRFEFRGAFLNSVKIIAPVDDYHAHGGDWVGSVSGNAYRFSRPQYPHSLVAAGRLFPAPPTLMDSTGALSDSGWFAARESETWSSFHVPAGKYRAFRVRRGWRGLGVDLTADTGATVHRHLRDVQTILKSADSSMTTRMREGLPISYPGKEDGFMGVHFHDPDGNYLPPIFRLIGPKDTVILSKGFVHANPEMGYGCSASGTCLFGDSAGLMIILRPDSVRLTMPVKKGTVAFPGSPCANRGLDTVAVGGEAVFDSAGHWKSGYRLEVSVGTDKLVIVHEGPAAVRLLGQPPSAADGPFLSGYRLDGRRVSGGKLRRSQIIGMGAVQSPR